MTHTHKKLGNRGGIDVVSWIMGLTGFVATYFIWVFCEPAIKALVSQGQDMNLPDIANQKFAFINMVYDAAMLVNAAVWIVFIFLSSIRSEVQERDIPIM